MNESLLRCAGMQAGSLLIPPFEVGERDFIQLRVPAESATCAQDVVAAFVGPKPDAAVRNTVEVVCVDFAFPRSGIREFFRWERAAEWFSRHTGRSHNDAAEILSQFDIPAQQAVCTFAGNPRKLLSLAATYERGCRLIIFECAGMDPMGVRRFVREVAARLEQSAAIQVASETNKKTCTELGLDKCYTKVINCQITGPSPIRETTAKSLIQVSESSGVRH